MDIKDKIVLLDKQSVRIPSTDLVATLKWISAVDLDLYCFYKTNHGYHHMIYYGDRGALKMEPYIQLDHDAGVGDTGGDNEENIRIKNLDGKEHLLIVANIFAKRNAKFSSYGGCVFVKGVGKEIEVHLTSEKRGSWCIVAHIDNSDVSGPVMHNVNLTIPNKPHIDNYLSGRYSHHEKKRKKCFLSRIFGG